MVRVLAFAVPPPDCPASPQRAPTGRRLLNAQMALNLSIQAKADVAGMNYNDLRLDLDFRRAVGRVVEICTVSGSSISC